MLSPMLTLFLRCWTYFLFVTAAACSTYSSTQTETDYANKYTIVLKNTANLTQHIAHTKLHFPTITIEKIYWQLIAFNFHGYTASFPNEEFKDSFRQAFQEELKVFEAVTVVHAATSGTSSGATAQTRKSVDVTAQKLPYTPSFSRLDESLSVVATGFCMIPYEDYEQRVKGTHTETITDTFTGIESQPHIEDDEDAVVSAVTNAKCVRNKSTF